MDKIVEVCQANAAYLLKEFGEFYPFAYGIRKNNEIVSVNAFDGDEFPASIDVIEELKKALIESDKANHFDTVCICIDVSFTPKGREEKTDGLQLKINCRDSGPIEYLIPYELKNNSIAFGEIEKYSSEMNMLW